MKFYEITEDNCNFFVNDLIIKNIDFSNPSELEKLLKNIMLIIKKKYHVLMNGLYYVDIYVNKNAGAFIYMERNDSFIRSKEIDMKIKIVFDDNFFFKTSVYEILKNELGVYYYENYYYIKTSKLNNLVKYIEYGDIIYDSDLDIENIGTKIN